MRRYPTNGFTITEMLVVGVTALVLVAAGAPVMRQSRLNDGVQGSMNNLAALGVAHLLYAADWNGRQVTVVRDDLGAYGGDVGKYNSAMGCNNGFDPGCQPGIIAGWGPVPDGGGAVWGWWPGGSNNVTFQPLNFPGPPNAVSSVDGWGHFRVPNVRPLHDYLGGRYHDATYFAPNDTVVWEQVGGCLDSPWEFVSTPVECSPAWSSYSLSAAAMFHPDVFRSNGAGGWQAPWELQFGYQSPGLFQATYPALKTHMLEQHWLQNPPATCNPAWQGPSVWSCEPYYFNHGLGSSPVTLFYDGHVRQLPNTEVLIADQQVFEQSGGIDGVWHRGTPFGLTGYFLDVSFDGSPLSHHVLTTDGILGRDTLGGIQPLSPPRSRRVPRPVVAGAPGGAEIIPPDFMFPTPMEDEP